MCSPDRALLFELLPLIGRLSAVVSLQAVLVMSVARLWMTGLERHEGWWT